MLRSVVLLFTLVGIVLSSTMEAPAAGGGGPAVPSDSERALQWLENEMTATSAAQSEILRQLRGQHLIPIGQLPRSLAHLRRHPDQASQEQEEDIKSRIVVSTSDNNVECRISLGRAPLGAVCVSPCGCVGSQKWIQFRELNTLRRKDPSQWAVCQTCQQKIEYDIFSHYGGTLANVVGLVLDNTNYLRSALLLVSAILFQTLSVGHWTMRLLASRPVWQLYPHWSKVTHLPLALKFWLGRLVLGYGLEHYVTLEKSVFLSRLIELETALVERSLPVDRGEDVDEDAEDGLIEEDDDDDDEEEQDREIEVEDEEEEEIEYEEEEEESGED